MTLQSDPSWLPSRNGCLSASRFKDAISFLKQSKKDLEAGKPPVESADRRKYKMELVAERIAGYAVSKYVTPAMQRGLDLEPAARDLFEETTGFLLGPARLFLHPTIPFFVATPDATLGLDTVVEFKCPLVSTFIDWVEVGTIPEDHIAQMNCQLVVTGRSKAIFVAYCPEMPEPRRLFIRKYEPTPEVLAEVEAQAIQFLKEVDELFDRVTATEAPAEEDA